MLITKAQAGIPVTFWLGCGFAAATGAGLAGAFAASNTILEVQLSKRHSLGTAAKIKTGLRVKIDLRLGVFAFYSSSAAGVAAGTLGTIEIKSNTSAQSKIVVDEPHDVRVYANIEAVTLALVLGGGVGIGGFAVTVGIADRTKAYTNQFVTFLGLREYGQHAEKTCK